MTKLMIETCRGRLMHQYPGQTQEQGRYIEIYKSGRLLIDWNAEIGNAVPASIWHGIIRRIHIPFTTKAEAANFIKENRGLFERVIAGMDEKWDGNNHVGTLTEDANEALNALEYKTQEAY